MGDLLLEDKASLSCTSKEQSGKDTYLALAVDSSSFKQEHRQLQRLPHCSLNSLYWQEAFQEVQIVQKACGSPCGLVLLP